MCGSRCTWRQPRPNCRCWREEAVAARPDLIVTNGTPATLAVLAETRSIPVLFFEIADPVGNGIVGNLSRPGGNVTGFTTFEPSLGGKWLQLLKEIDPQVKRAAILFNPETARNRASPFVREFEAVAASLSIEPILAFAQDASGIEPVMAALAAEPGGALLVLPDVFTFSQRRLIIDLAEQYRVPAIYGTRYMAATGGPARLWSHHGGAPPRSRLLHGSDSQGRQPWRVAGSGTDAIRARRQSRDRKGAGPHSTAKPRSRRRRGDRVRAALEHRTIFRTRWMRHSFTSPQWGEAGVEPIFRTMR